VDPPLHRAGQTQLVIPYAAMSMKGHVVIQFNVHKDGSITTCRWSGQARWMPSQRRLRRAVRLEPDSSRCRRISDSKAFFTVTFFYKRRRRG